LARYWSVRRWTVFLPGIVILLLGGGLRTMEWTQPHDQPFTVSLLQGNVPQSLKWDPQRLSLSMETYASLAQAHPAQLVVLPETAIPLMFNEIPRDYFRQLSGDGSHVLIGAAVGVSANSYAVRKSAV